MDRQAQFHRRFRRDDTRDDHDAIKEFALLETTLNPFHPYIPACGDSENEKGSDEEERLEVVGTDSLSAGKHCANELALRSAETGAKNDRKATTIGRTRRLSRA